MKLLLKLIFFPIWFPFWLLDKVLDICGIFLIGDVIGQLFFDEEK